MRDLDDYYKKYVEDNFDHVLSDYRRVNVEVELIKKTKARNIVEIGCGINPIFFHYRDFEHLTIIEPANGFYSFVIDKLNGEYRDIRDKVRVLHKPLQEVKALEQDPDLVICAGLMQEMINPGEIPDGIYRISGPETIGFISTVNENSFHRLLAKEAGLIKELNQRSDEQIKFQRYHVFNKETLSQVIKASGFKVLETETYFIKPFTNEQMNMLIKEKLINMDTIMALGKMIKYMPELGAEIYAVFKKMENNR